MSAEPAIRMAQQLAQARAIEKAPASCKGALSRAFSGHASPRDAIKAHCLTCTGFDRSAVRNCTAYACALHFYRPFQETAELPLGEP